jgi:hypothetical protein
MKKLKITPNGIAELVDMTAEEVAQRETDELLIGKLKNKS